jgi:molecular chaperone GrpE
MGINFLKKKKMKKQPGNNTVEEKQHEDNEQSLNAQSDSSVEEQSLPDAEKSEASPEAKLEVELSEARDKYLRLYSDFENYKKRIARDRVEQAKMAGADVFLSVLPVMDDMERAIKAMNDANNIQTIKEGLMLIYSKLKSGTESKGLKAMESIGKIFDSDLHDAITNVPAPSDDMKGKVVDEIEKGYYLNDKVIRHAKVIVGN